MICKLKLKKTSLFLYMSANIAPPWYNINIRKEGIGMVLPLKKTLVNASKI
jgi:hypothetical protein